MKRQAVTYRRVSTDRQAKEGQSLASQREQVTRYCKLRNWAVVKHCEDQGRSGRSREERPGLQEAISEARERKGVLVAYSLSRLSRSVVDAAAILNELRSAGADLAIVDCSMDTSTASGQLIFNIFSSIAQFESQLIGERIKLANDRTVASKGYRTNGGQPAGWAIVGGVRVPEPRERAVMDRVLNLSKTVKLPGEMAEILHAEGVPTISQLRNYKGATGWTSKTVSLLLKRMAMRSAS